MAQADLWQRIWGHDITQESTDPQDRKLALHRFWGALSEWAQGYETQANIISMFNLAAGVQLQQGALLKSYLDAAPDKVAFLRVCKDWSYIAEVNTSPEAAKYQTASLFLARLSDEIVAQGGTTP
jgi:hypothetical protein